MSGMYRNIILNLVTPQGERTLSLSFPAEFVRDRDINAGRVRITVDGVTRAKKLPPGCSFSTEHEGSMNAESTKVNRPDWTVIWTGDAFEALPLVQASLRLKAMKREHAERLAEKMNADTATADVVEAFGPGSEAA